MIPDRTNVERRRWLRAIGAAFVLCIVVCAGLTACTTRRTPPAPAPTGSPDSTELAAIGQVFARHGDALLHHDRKAWLADLDTSDAAAGYRGAQTSLFDNIASVPLTSWTYAVSSVVPDETATSAAASRLGTRVAIIKVSLHYGLSGVDPVPTAKDTWITVARRGKAWRLAGDSDLAEEAGESWKGPWDFGPVAVTRTAHVLVLAHPATASRAAQFAALVERAEPAIDAVWGTAWNHVVAVELPDTDAEFSTVAGSSPEVAALAAVTVHDQVTGSGVVPGARMVFNPQNLGALSEDGRRLVVTHELVHIATAATTTDNMPTWLVEGFADFVANGAVAQPVKVAAAELVKLVRAGQAPTHLPGDDDFATAGRNLDALYEQSWLACRLLARQYGVAALVRFYVTVARQSVLTPGNATADAFGSVLHTTIDRFTAAWRAQMVAELR